MYKAPTAKEWMAINRVLSHYQVTESCTDEAQRIVENFLLPEFKDTMVVSNCCGVSLIEETDLCSHCKEHCSEEVHHG